MNDDGNHLWEITGVDQPPSVGHLLNVDDADRTADDQTLDLRRTFEDRVVPLRAFV